METYVEEDGKKYQTWQVRLAEIDLEATAMCGGFVAAILSDGVIAWRRRVGDE